VRRKMHRFEAERSVTEDSIGARLTTQRLKLKCSQDDIAKRVRFRFKTGAQAGKSLKLSRTALASYEAGTTDALVDMPKLGALAAALQVTTRWLIYGGADRSDIALSSVVNGNLSTVSPSWSLHEWLGENFEADASGIILLMIPEFTADWRPGDIAIVQRSAEVGAITGEFAFIEDRALRIAQVSRAHGIDAIRVFGEDNAREEIPLKKVTVLGRVLGKLSARERR